MQGERSACPLWAWDWAMATIVVEQGCALTLQESVSTPAQSG